MPLALARPARPLPVLLLSALIVAAALALAPAAHATEEKPRTITITGEGEVTAAPDIAYVGTGVVTEGKTAGEALAANTAAMEKVFAGLEKAGIEKRDMQTSNFSVYPVYEQVRPEDRPHTPKIGGYRVQNQLTVKVRDLDNLGTLLDKIVTLCSNQLSGIRFSIDDPKPLLNEAREAAVKDALAKAKLYAGAAGVAVGEIMSISESGSSMPQPFYAKDMMMSARAEGAPVPMAAGEQTITANVTLVIRIN